MMRVIFLDAFVYDNDGHDDVRGTALLNAKERE